jgi:PAS domain S-box-containing protein
MSDETKTQAQLLEEVERLRREAADLKAALDACRQVRPLRELPGDYDLLFESFSEPLLVVRVRDGLILRANPLARRLVGATEAGLAGKTLYDLMPEDHGARAEAMMREAAAGNRLIPPHDAAYRRADGTLAPVRVTGAIVDSEPEATALFYLEDVTEALATRRRLQEAEQRYRLVVESAADPIFVLDRSGRFTAANAAASKALGRRPEEIVGKTQHDLFPPAIAEQQGRHVQEVFERGKTLLFEEEKSYTPEGPRRYNTSLTPVKNERGEVEYVIGIARDVTDRKRAEEALRESERELNAIYEAMRDGILIADVETRQLMRANPAVLRMFGYSEEEMLRLSVSDIHPKDALPEVLKGFTEQALGQRYLAPDLPCLRKDGTVFFADVPVARMMYRGRPCMAGMFRDVTERRRAEEALRESEARYRAVVESQTEMICRFVPESTLTFVNDAYCRFFGKSREELIGRSFLPLIPEEDRAETVRHFAPVSADRPVVDHEHRVTMPSGEVRWMHWTNRGFFDDQGRLVEFQAVGHDITDRKVAEDALRQSEANYRAIFNAANDFIWVYDLTTRAILDANESMCRAFGYSREEVRGLTIRDISAREGIPTAERVAERHERFIRDGRLGPFEWLAKDRQGRKFWCEANLKVVNLQGHDRALAVVRDISERKKVEEALRQSEENYRLLFEESMLGIAVVVEGRIVKANKALCDIFRAGIDWLAARSVLELVDPGDRGRAAGQMAVLQGGTSSHVEGTYQVIRADGTTGQVEDRSGRMTWEGKPAVLSMIQDVTERVRLENELREAQKMEAVGQLAGGIAHDFNNLLTGILCNAQLLKSAPGAAEDVHETADVIEKAARRAAELTGQLLGFARRGKRQDVPVDLGSTVGAVVRLMSGTLDPRIAVATALPREAVWAQGDPAQMEQVALNLAMNARDAMPGGGRLTLSAETVDLDAAACAGRPKAKPGRYAVLSVSDTGRGVPEDIRERIFEPFFTTKPKGKGTGMGLAMVYGIARNHGGWVEVESAVGHGSTFRVYLPSPPSEPADARAPRPGRRAEAQASRRRKAAGANPPRRTPAPQAACVLVVDDDEFVRNALTRMLAGMGYSVVTASSGREAIATYGMFGPSVDVVILDMVMPDLDGRECFRALRRLDPNIKAILCTGGPADGGRRDMLEEGMVGFIQKPYRPEQLSEAIAKALAGSR